MTHDSDALTDQIPESPTGRISLNKSPASSAGPVLAAQTAPAQSSAGQQPNQYVADQYPASQQGGPSPWQAPAVGGVAAVAAGAPSQGWQPGTQAAGNVAQNDVAQKKLIAGLLGIFLGSLGIHKFYLGMNQPGIIMLALTVGGWALFVLLAIILIGFVFLLLPITMGLIGLVEGILYLTKTDADFEREYILGQKLWF